MNENERAGEELEVKGIVTVHKAYLRVISLVARRIGAAKVTEACARAFLVVSSVYSFNIFHPPTAERPSTTCARVL